MIYSQYVKPPSWAASLYIALVQRITMLDKLFRRNRKKEPPEAEGPDISFGRYSDNNKPVAKVNRWTDADNLYKEKKYEESLDAFFDYLRDDTIQNVVYERNGAEGRFHFYQGSKVVRGEFNNDFLKADVTLAKMPQPSVPVMRRLLEMNFNLYYSRYALDEGRLCMNFDSDIETASPSKLYYGLKELSTRADKQDDLLVQDFTILETSDSEHVSELPQQEKDIKYEWVQKWIEQTLETISKVDADKFSGGIAYMLLSLIYRIDYLISPEGKLLHDLEKIAGIYFKKDERQVVEKSRDMIEEFRKMKAMPKEEIVKSLFRSRYTFAIVAPQQYKTIADSIHGANQNFSWYRDNNHAFIATQIIEYGITYCQYSYSLPKVITEFIHLFMRVNHPEFFSALGYRKYYDPASNQFEQDRIIEKIKSIQEQWKEKYPLLNFNTANLKFDNLVNFDHSFTVEMEALNTETK